MLSRVFGWITVSYAVLTPPVGISNAVFFLKAKKHLTAKDGLPSKLIYLIQNQVLVKKNTVIKKSHCFLNLQEELR